MLAKPKKGWSRITIGNWSESCSYLDDVPIILLRTIGSVVFSKEPQFVRFDAEGWEYIIIFSVHSVEIFSENPTDEFYPTPIFEYHSMRIKIEELAYELISDIRQNIDEWVSWDFDAFKDKWSPSLRSLRRDQLIALCNELERIIQIPSESS